MADDAYPWDRPDRAKYPHFNHLLTEGARTRYILAAHYVEDCDTVVEIGGSRTPITGFITRPPRAILVVDPKMDPFHADTLHGRPCRVDHLRKTFQDHEFDLEPGRYGLVILGLSLKHFTDAAEDVAPTGAAEWRKLVSLIDNALVTVLEHPLGWELGQREVNAILHGTATEVKLDLILDLGENEGEDTPFPRRRMLVLTPRSRA